MEDQRVRVSKSMLKSALLDLLGEKDLEQISVSELCRRAHINRTTFYKYYDTPQDLLGAAADDFFDGLEQHLLGSSAPAEPPDVYQLSDALEYLDSQRKVFVILVNSIPDQVFMERLFRIPASIHYSVDNICPGTDPNYVNLFLFQGGYAVIRSWLNSEHPEPAVEIAQLIQALWKRLT